MKKTNVNEGRANIQNEKRKVRIKKKKNSDTIRKLEKKK